MSRSSYRYVTISWCGDAHERCLIAPDIIEALRYVDLQLVVNAKVLPTYKQLGINAAFWEIGFKESAEPYPDPVPEYDVLVQMNTYSQDRIDLIEMLQSMDVNLGVYGNAPGSVGNSHYSFSMQAALYQSAKINVGDTFPGTYAYCSNRLIQCLGNGGFLLNQRSEGLQEYTGITPDIHYVSWDNLWDLREKILFWLQPEQDQARREIAEAGCKFVRENYTYDMQIKKLFKLLP